MSVKLLERESVEDIDEMLVDLGFTHIEGQDREALCEEIQGSIERYRLENGSVSKIYAAKETLFLTSNPPLGCSTCGADSGCCSNIA